MDTNTQQPIPAYEVVSLKERVEVPVLDSLNVTIEIDLQEKDLSDACEEMLETCRAAAGTDDKPVHCYTGT